MVTAGFGLLEPPAAENWDALVFYYWIYLRPKAAPERLDRTERTIVWVAGDDRVRAPTPSTRRPDRIVGTRVECHGERNQVCGTDPSDHRIRLGRGGERFD